MKLKYFILLCLFCAAAMLFICYCGSEAVMKMSYLKIT